jgi:hypothetical protein
MRRERIPDTNEVRHHGAVSRTIAFVLGMHRSGTSAVTGALSALGAALPDDLLPPKDDNPRGFFESERLLALHDDLLTALGRSWDDVTPLPSDWLEQEAVEAFATGARSLLDELPEDGLVVVKDPRLCRLLPVWRRKVVRPGEVALVLFVTRPATEVVSSLVRREDLPAAWAWLLLAIHLTEALDAAAGLPTAVVSYPAVVERWEDELRPALERLGAAHLLHLDRADAVAAFLSGDLRHPQLEVRHLSQSASRLSKAVEDLISALDTARPALPPQIPLAELADSVAEAMEVAEAGAAAPRRLLAEQRLRSAAREQQLIHERDLWRASHDRQAETLAVATADLDATRTVLEETQQARSLRMARWLRARVPAWPGSGDRGAESNGE